MRNRFEFLSNSLRYVINNYPVRIRRIGEHIIFRKSKYRLPSENIIEWIGDMVFYIFDLLLIPELYELVLTIIKSRYRFLSIEEKIAAQKIFKSSIFLDFVRVNTQMSAWIATKAHAYVTLNTINYRKKISHPILMHELVHVWQYQRFGSMYIYRSLKAQSSKEKYDYGGPEGLYNGLISQKKLTDFNFEQQGAIVEDYVRTLLTDGGFSSPIVNATYVYYIAQLEY